MESSLYYSATLPLFYFLIYNANDMARNTITDEAARKRQEIGLSARRETARTAVMRPPTNRGSSTVTTADRDAEDVGGFGGWWLAAFVSLLAIATFLLVAARFLQSPTDLVTVDTQVANITRGKLSLQGLQGVLDQVRQRTGSATSRELTPRLFDDFSSADSLLPSGGDDSRSQQVDVQNSVYQMRVESGNAAWSLLGDSSLKSYRLETSARVSFEHPQSSAGLIVRFVDENHFYLFVVDGEGRFQVLRANGEGNWQELLPWLPSPAINGAGVGNVLEVEDRGSEIHFSVNGTPLFRHQVAADEVERTGDAGLWSAATGKDLAVVEFDRIRLEPLDNP